MIPLIKSTYNRFWQNCRFWLSSHNTWPFLIYYKWLYKPQLGSIQVFLDAYSLEHRPFTVIQVGANDGITHDLIHKFIKRDHWQGVLLEPQERVFNRLEKLYRLSKGITCVHAALGKEDGKATLYKIAFSTARWATGLASFRKEVITSAFESGYIQKKAAQEGVRIPANPDDQIQVEHISVISPQQLIVKYQLDNVQLLQIDTEGFDYEVITIFHDAGLLPEAIVFEHVHLGEDNRYECSRLLNKQGYALWDFGKDTLAVKGNALITYKKAFGVA